MSDIHLNSVVLNQSNQSDSSWIAGLLLLSRIGGLDWPVGVDCLFMDWRIDCCRCGSSLEPAEGGLAAVLVALRLLRAVVVCCCC